MSENLNTEFQIGGSVGRWSKGAANAKADVETVQNMLRTAAMILNNPQVDPGGIDGAIGKDEAKSDTVKAIEAFQGRFVSAPDGVVGVGKRTWRELMTVLEGSNTGTESPAPPIESPAQPSGNAQFFFPFSELPNLNWTESMRRFGAQRKGRAHAACDLYFPTGTTIHAITAGKVTRGPYAFYQGTFALEIDHGPFLARYGEIQESAFVRSGEEVNAGQPIARVGNLIGITNSMLHLELYDKTAAGPLTVGAVQSARASDGRPFMRRKDLIDPTTRLNEWKNNLPG
jgi:murein DD-endopeptidase MepM/ murein hydrolase activator NlpD